MRVLLISTSFPLYPGHPSGQFVYHLARKLAAKGVEVEALVPHTRPAKTHEVMEGVAVHRFVYLLPRAWQGIAYGPGIPTNLSHNPLLWWQVPLFMASLLAGVAALGRRCQILHPFWTPAAAAAALLKGPLGKPVVMAAMGSDINLAASWGPLRWLTGLVLRRADRVIAVSQALKKGTCRLGVAPERVEVIPLGVDPQEFERVADSPGPGNHLLWAGRMAPEKGLHHLLAALKLVVREVPSARLTLVGDGPLQGGLEGQAVRLGLQGRVHFAGSRLHGDLPQLMAGADLFVLPSLTEGLPTVVAEAMAAGLPVVASRVGGVPEVMAEGETGLLVAPGDVEGLAEAILTLLKDPARRRHMGRQGQERARALFTWDRIAEATIQVYHRVLGTV